MWNVNVLRKFNNAIQYLHCPNPNQLGSPEKYQFQIGHEPSNN